MLVFFQKVLKYLRNRWSALRRQVPLFISGNFIRLMVYHIALCFIRRRVDIEAPERNKPHFLILRYRYYSENKAMGDSTEKVNVDGSLAASHLATFDVLCYDTDFAPSPWGDLQFLKKCRQIQPDAIILSSWLAAKPHPAPSIEVLQALRKRWHIPIVAIWWDTCWKGFWRSVEPILPFIDLNIVPENPKLHFIDRHSRYFASFLPLWVPFDPVIYNNDHAYDRDLSVCFLGQVEHARSYRLEYIQHILNHKIPIYLSTANRDSQPSHADYVDVLKRSRIGINFSYSFHSHQLKGRVFETMLCGAMLMESENDQISQYFVPMEDYVSFSSKEDLIEKLHYYLEHDDERLEIAARGERKAREHYNHFEFWQAVLDRLAQIQKMTR